MFGIVLSVESFKCKVCVKNAASSIRLTVLKFNVLIMVPYYSWVLTSSNEGRRWRRNEAKSASQIFSNRKGVRMPRRSNEDEGGVL